VAPVAPVAPAPPAPTLSQPAEPQAARPPLSLLDVVRTTLRTHPEIARAENNLAQRRAEVRIAEGPFDPLFLANAGHTHDEFPTFSIIPGTPPTGAVITDTTTLGIGASWRSTWGMSLLPNATLSRIHQRPAGDCPFGLICDPTQRASVGLTVIQPLLRGAGTTATASGIDAARAGRDATSKLVAFTAQQRVVLAISSYFQFVAASEQLALLRDEAASADKMLAETRTLVQADQRPRTDLDQLEGTLAIRVRSVREAENNELQALYALRDAMGLSAGSTAFWQPVNALPTPRPAPVDRAGLIRQARLARKDVQAARGFAASTAALLRGAEYNTKPALDLSASVGYNGAVLDDGVGPFLSSAGRNVPGVNAGVGLSLELPIGNTAREGERDLRHAQHNQSKLAISDLERRVPLNVLSALDDLRMSAAQLEASNVAVREFQQALANEHDRLRAGLGTIIDVVLTQEQLIRAQLSQVVDHLRYAVAAARLEFETGSMPSEESEAPAALNRMFDLSPAGGPRAGK
jgi:outer membrane protein TolC